MTGCLPRPHRGLGQARRVEAQYCSDDLMQLHFADGKAFGQLIDALESAYLGQFRFEQWEQSASNLTEWPLARDQSHDLPASTGVRPAHARKKNKRLSICQIKSERMCAPIGTALSEWYRTALWALQ